MPSASAHSLASSSSKLIGLLVPATDEDSLMISPHHMAIAGHAERELRKSGYHLLLRGIARLAEVTEALHSWSLDGAILLGFVDEQIDKRTKATAGPVPMAAIDSYSRNRLTAGPRSDDFVGARLAAEHLLSLGHRDIVFAGPEFCLAGVVRERFDGFRAAFDDAGVPWAPGMVEVVNTTHHEGLGCGKSLPRRHPSVTAVFATADILAVGIMEGLITTGFSVPRDVSVVGFDDLEFSKYVTPKLTTVIQDIGRKGATAVAMLVAAIEQQVRPAHPVTLDVSLTIRDSTAPPKGS
ncbi:LacI family DNA-binding transcriptional regulator [Amycolatopsis sp. CA-128772]|uniref:LacI family DNA-binding transcriptional regulator n=1 Tax=Amycolatopsis sp. CA-128772 TaxID=2073159 RepID=UPI0018ED1CF7|nr:substrate-binding domain-containing protein [Amycolatopsis sp. CA-128772]